MRFAWLSGLVVLAACSASPGAEPTGTTEEAVQQCETTVVEGVDVSAGQGTIDWTSVKGAGVDFAIMKATQGTYYTASNFAANWSGTKAAGVLRSPYHFFDPTEDGAKQAQFFLSVVGTLGPGDLPAMLDMECPTGAADTKCLGNGMTDAATATEIATRMWAFIHAVETATGKKPLIYTYGSYFSSNGVSTAGLDAYPLYIADPVSGSCFSVPSPWTTADFWQWSWTGTVAGITGQVDRDRFIGTLAQLQTFANGPAPADAGIDAATAGDAATGPEGGAEAGVDAGVHVDSGGPVSAEGGEAGPQGAAIAAPGPASGCGCRVEGSRGPSGAGLGALALALAGAWRRRQSTRRMLAGRSKERPSCRRPTSARA